MWYYFEHFRSLTLSFVLLFVPCHLLFVIIFVQVGLCVYQSIVQLKAGLGMGNF